MGGLALSRRLFAEFSDCRGRCFQHTRRQPVKDLRFSRIVGFNGLGDIAGCLIDRLASGYLEGRNWVDVYWLTERPGGFGSTGMRHPEAQTSA